MRTLVTILVAVSLCLLWGACGTADSLESENIDRAEEALCIGYSGCSNQCGTNTCNDECNCSTNGTCGHHCPVPHGVCNSGVCGCEGAYVLCGSVCDDLTRSETNCGSCGHACLVGGETWLGEHCRSIGGVGVCKQDCIYHQQCPSGQICRNNQYVDLFDQSRYWTNTGDPGYCAVKTCVTDSDCATDEAVGGNYAYGSVPAYVASDDNRLRCLGGVCYATASDPHHCTTLNQDICGSCETCETYKTVPGGLWITQGCGGPSCAPCQAKSYHGYWRDCDGDPTYP